MSKEIKALSYEEKLQIANTYIDKLTGGFTWEDLPDINSLHDAETEEDVRLLCNERLEEDNFPLDEFLQD